jgi:hypothetical protein
MGSTPNFGWTFPDPASTVDVPRDIEELARDIDTSMRYVGVPPLCSVRQTVTQSIANNVAAYVPLNFDTEDIDPLDMHTAASPSRMTVKIAGVYRLAGCAGMGTNATGVRRCGWFLNGATFPHAVNQQPGSTVSVALLMAASFMAAFAVNDYVELRVFQDSGGALATPVGNGNQSWASMEWIRP